MEREWLEKFYTECGREVSLAYNVLNHSNSWGVTLVTAVLATGFISLVKFESGKMTLDYPTIFHWFYIIIAWIIMLRFFVRSALGLTNMYRWNTLIYASSKVLSLPEESPILPVYLRNCHKKIDAYYYRWKSPISQRKIIWENLKLMYFWFFLIVLALFVWGAIVLVKNWLYYVGIGLFVVSTIIESIWFVNWRGFKYEKLDLEKEPDIIKLWQERENMTETDQSKVLTLGFCEEGPFKYAVSLLNNPDIKWVPWSYHVGNIAPDVINDLSRGYSLKDRRVAFACWSTKFRGDASVLRFGKIDHCTFIGGILRITVFLEDYDEKSKNSKVVVDDPNLLCFYLMH
jgi:hypothetical protein